MEARQGRHPWKPRLLALILMGAVLLLPAPAQTTQFWPENFPRDQIHRPGRGTSPPGTARVYPTPGEMRPANNPNLFSAQWSLNLATQNFPGNRAVPPDSGPEAASPPTPSPRGVAGTIRVKGANHLSPYLDREDNSRGRAPAFPRAEQPPPPRTITGNLNPEVSTGFLFYGEFDRPLKPGLSGGDRLPPLPSSWRHGHPDIFIPAGEPEGSFPLTDNNNTDRYAPEAVIESRLAAHHSLIENLGTFAWTPGDLTDIILIWTLEFMEPGRNPFSLWLGFFTPGTIIGIFLPPPRPPVPLPASGWLFLSGLVGLALRLIGRKKI